LITLYSGPLSLFARKVEIALGEKGLPFSRVMVAFNQTVGYSPKHPDVVAANPKKQVPVLNDGSLLIYDSTVILEYLEDAYPNPPFFPSSPPARARCRMLELYADEIMLTPLRSLMHRTGARPGDASRWVEWEAKARLAEDELSNQYGVLEVHLADDEYFCEAFSVADIAVFMPVHFCQRLGGPSLRNHPALLKWYSRMCSRPAFGTAVADIRNADLELSSPVANAYPDDQTRRGRR
jgi:glutathione S-transferase